MIGETLGNYRIVEQIGMGGMATVYKAYDPDTDRYVALKILPRHLSQDPTFKERFDREAKAIAKLEHLHIIPIYTYGEDHGVAYMAMRYLPVGTLTDRIRRGPLPLPEASRLLTQIAGALDYAHSHGLLHRDIKPSNVLLDNAGNAFLTDFGIAKMIESTVDLTAGNLLGTPAYMSPEQCQGVKELTAASDIYSLGIVLYEMVTGIAPFRAETPVAIIYKQLHDPLPPPHQLRPDLPDEAQQVILKALAKAPESRYDSCGQLAAAFAAAVANSPTVPALESPTLLSSRADVLPAVTQAQPADTPTVAAAPQKKSRWLWAGAALLLLVLLAGIALVAGRLMLRRATSPPVASSGPAADAPGPLLFEDDFAGQPSTRWRFLPEPWPVDTVDGRAAMRNVPSAQAVSAAEIRQTDWGDYTVQFDFRFLQPDGYGENYFYLRTRYGQNCPPTIASTNSYVLLVSPDTTELRKETCQLEGQQPTLARSDLNFDPDAWHTLRLTAVSNRILLQLDGAEIINFADDIEPHLGSDVVLETENGAEFAIANFQVTAASPANLPGPAAEAAPPQASRCAPGENELFFDDFEAGHRPAWNFFDAAGQAEGPWNIGQEGDNHYFVGEGHRWATVGAEDWADYRLRLRYRKLDPQSDAHINIRASDGRYYVNLLGGALSRDNSLTGERNQQLARWDAPADTAWHELVLLAIGDRVEVLLDGREVATFNDAHPLRGGPVGLENLSNQPIWYDDVLVCQERQPRPAEAAEELPAQRVIEPCEWVSEEHGLCIFSTLEDAPPLKILADVDLQFEDVPSWSPDGRLIAFGAREPEGDPDEGKNIYIVKADGSGLRRLPEHGNDHDPVWSPNGEWLAFHNNGNYAVMRPDGSDYRLVWERKDERCALLGQWAPDSERLVVSIQQDSCSWEVPFIREIWLLTVGKEPRHLLDVPQNDPDCVDVYIAFSPDGRRIAYTDGECQAFIASTLSRVNASLPVDGFPREWTANHFPQWPDRE